MKKRTRRILFLMAVLIFGGASWIAILYAQGYKYDFSRRTFVRTGAVAVTVNTDAKLFVDDVLRGDTSFLANRVGQDELLPGTHTIYVLRENWSSWRKTIEIKEGLLVDFPAVLILPTDEDSQAGVRDEITKALLTSRTLEDTPPSLAVSPVVSPKPKPPAPTEYSLGEFTLRGMQLWRTTPASSSLLAENVLGFAITNNNDRVLWWTRNEIWVRWLRTTDYQPFRIENETMLITRFSVPILRASWFRDHDHVVVSLGNNSYRIIETDIRGGINIIKI